MARGDGYSLIKRKRKGKELAHFEVRIFVPASWREALGRTERLVSTGTGDRRMANMVAPDIVARQLAEWREIVGAPTLIDADPISVAVRVGYDEMLARMEERRKAWPADDAEYTARLAASEAHLRRWTRRLQDGDLQQWEEMADRMISTRGLPLRKGSDAYAEYVHNLALISIDAVSTFLRRSEGELDAAPRSLVVQEVKAKKAAEARPGETLLDYFEKWAAERLAKKMKRPDTVIQDRKKIEQFMAFVGANRAVDSITAADVFAYREALRDLPPKWAVNKKLEGLPLRDAAKRARELDMPRTAFTTVNQHLSTISPLYKWLAGTPTWAGLRNPCDGLFHDGVKGQNPRPPLTTEALNKILASPLFVGCKADGEVHTPGEVKTDDWRKWILLACMFTGARLGEIAQLRVGDVRQERGVWLVDILEEEREGLTTKNRKGHHVPVHSKLIALGFIEFVKRQREARGGDAPLFVGVERDDRGQFAKVARWYRDFFKAIGVKNGKDGIGLHSFRHTLSDRLRDEAELLDTQIAVILDHSVKTTTGGYGTLKQGTVKMMKEWIEGVTFEGVDFSRLIKIRA